LTAIEFGMRSGDRPRPRIEVPRIGCDRSKSAGARSQCVQGFRCRSDGQGNVFLAVSECDDRMQSRRRRGIDAEFKQLVHESSIGEAIDVLAELTIVANCGLVGKHDLEHRADALNDRGYAFLAEKNLEASRE